MEHPVPQKVADPNQLRALTDLNKIVPERWRSAEIGICDSLGRVNRVVRVSFHRNSDGRRIILFHNNEVKL